MAGHVMNKITILAATALFALAGCGGGAGDPATAPLAGARMGGAFTLVDQDGQAVTDQSWPGQYRLVYFGYTYCPDVCPVDVQVMSQGLSKFEKTDPAHGRKVQPIFITVDPARDTQKALKAFVSNFHPRLVGLTGTEAQIELAAKNYAVIFEREKPNAAGAYLVNHSRYAVLYAPDGKPLVFVPQDKNADAVAASLATWVK